MSDAVSIPGIPLTSKWALGPTSTPASRAEHAGQFAAIVEGSCPTHEPPLYRLSSCGWCFDCGHGWAVRQQPRDAEWCPGERVVIKTHHAGLDLEDQTVLALEWVHRRWPPDGDAGV